MRKPAPATYLYGNNVSALVILVGGGFILFKWWQGQLVGDMIPVVTFVLMIAAVNANQQISKYGAWKRTWDAMGGVETTARRRRLFKVLGGIVWLLAAAVLANLDYHQPGATLALMGFAFVNAVVIGCMLFRSWRRRAARPRVRKEVPVSICLPVPRNSPDARQHLQDLPDYCARLI